MLASTGDQWFIAPSAALNEQVILIHSVVEDETQQRGEISGFHKRLNDFSQHAF